MGMGMADAEERRVPKDRAGLTVFFIPARGKGLQAIELFKFLGKSSF